MKKKILFVFVTLVLVVTSLTSCVGKGTTTVSESTGDDVTTSGETASTEETTSETSGDVVVINYPTFQIGVNTAAKPVAQLVKEFNETYAGKYEIVIEEIPGDANYLDKIKVMIASGTVPPVIYSAGAGTLDLALAEGLVLDITDDVNADPAWLALYSDDAMKMNSRDGRIYASSNEGFVYGYYYNKDLFAQAGIDAPATTWAEFAEDCDKLLAAGITPLAMDTGDGAWLTQLWMGAMIASSGDEGLEFMKTTYPTDYNIQPVIDAAAMVQEWFGKYTTADAVGGLYENGANNFFTENVAMIANGPWMIGDFSDLTKTSEGFADKVGVAVYPGPFVYGGVIEGMFATKQDDPALEEAAVAMVKFFTSAHAQQTMLEMQGMLPASPTVEITDAAKINYPLLAELLDLTSSVTTRSSTFTSNMLPGVRDVVTREMPNLASGAITPEEFCQFLTDTAEDAAGN